MLPLMSQTIQEVKLSQFVFRIFLSSILTNQQKANNDCCNKTFRL
uniref:Uncharacterized protein n=1 Tax=Arundo donax TaxID=35708 RepID=A0A0A8Z287_ARUDO